MDEQVCLYVPKSDDVTISDFLAHSAVPVSWLDYVADGLGSLLHKPQAIALLIVISDSFGGFQQAIAIEVNELDFAAIDDLLAHATLDNASVLLELLLELLCELAHADLVGRARVVLALGAYGMLSLLNLVRLVLDFECIIVFKSFIAAPRQYLKYAVSEVPEAQRVLNVPQLQKQVGLGEAL